MVRRPVEHPAGAQALLQLRTLLGPLLSDGSDSQGQTLQTALSCCAVADSCEGALSCLKSAELRGMHDVESLAPFANKQSTGKIFGSASCAGTIAVMYALTYAQATEA